MKSAIWTSVLVIAVAWPMLAVAETKPAAPFFNPHWAESSPYPVAHGTADFSPLAGPVGPGRRLRDDEVQWKSIGPVNGFAPVYSTPYANGKRVIWVGGYDRVSKLDADTLDVLTTYAIGGNTYFGDEEIRHHVAMMDKLDDKAMAEYGVKLWLEPFRSAASYYRLLTRENELYLPHRAADGAISIQVFGETDANDPASPIRLRREWKIPPEISRAGIFSINMTSDGWVVMVTQDGALTALSKDFTVHHVLRLPSKRDEAPGHGTQDLWASFVRNNLTVDDQGGIYVVTRDYMHRVQWTGSKLSLDEADGAWSAPYPNELGIGSGTSPSLMGWGPNEDHLVVIADGTRGNNMMAFWRDAIPEDWKGLPGMDRRVAGVTPIHFGVSDHEQAQVENALVVYGYGAFINNTFPVQHLPDQGSPTKQWLAESLYMHVPGHEARGGTMVRWDPQARTLKTAWQTQLNFASTVCTISGATEILYCWVNQNREWGLEGLDWKTGSSAFHYTIGKSHRFNPLGGPVIIAPNGAVDCGCSGGLGIVRVNPKRKH